ncbi:GntR family transcriptional regulator [Streptomyces sp. DvalAA-14]|uniref:GntR family transcriptional regulator n=1 Tax=unclassified Streptomyces TaxID=2593676 RepID=UPI00081B4EFF|nr:MULTISPECIES: GntR family transcriptional regulator [unclassified Streptomyces]MYS21022.1 UTRA domain-containing protein [Streptomyces sp. SID4948]SCD82372.1 GntR family transcriptional regulator [Streptomyces sp. DvalAA-14]
MDREPSRSALKRERVRDHLLELVESRAPGDPIPSERTLCEQLGVSRPTLRSAVDELVTTGLLIREHGRGMFVARAKITQELVPDASAHRLPRASGNWASRVLEFTVVQAGARVGRKLHISPAAEITYIARLRLVDGEPMAIEYLHVPAALVPGLSPADMESGDFYDVLRDRHRVRVHEAVQSIEPTVTNEEEARLIGVPVLSPALLFERLTRDDTGRPVEYVHSVYRGDRYRIVSRLSLGDAPAPAAPFTGARHHPGIPPGDLAGRGDVGALMVGDVQPAE